MPCRRPVLRTQPNSRCSASITGAEQVLRARFFSLRTRAASWLHTDLDSSLTRSIWRFHVPRLWNRSINGCKFPVKRKTQNVVDVSALRLFVVVLFPLSRRDFNILKPLVSSLGIVLSRTLGQRCKIGTRFRGDTRKAKAV